MSRLIWMRPVFICLSEFLSENIKHMCKSPRTTRQSTKFQVAFLKQYNQKHCTK